MEAQKLERGRLIDHIQLVVENLDASRAFYQAIFDELGIPLIDGGHGFLFADEFVISSRDSEAADGQLTGRHHIAFQANDRATVEAVHRAALGAGGSDHGAPGERPHYHPGYYAAFMLDPDGNNVEVVFHGEAKRSAPSVTIEW